MPKSRILLSAVVLTVINFFSITLGFWAYHLTQAANQIALQLPVALFTGGALALVWISVFPRWHRLDDGAHFMAVFLGAFVTGAVIFTGLHYVFTGYLTAFTNIIGIWMVQFLENMFGLVAGASILRNRRRQEIS